MGDKARAAAMLAAVIGVALWEALAAVRAPHLAPTEADYQAVAAMVRAGFVQGDLITCAPPWIAPSVRREMGDLMPAWMVGRPDSLAYGRIWEVSIRGERAEDTAALHPEFSEEHGRVSLSRYRQQAVTVTYDLAAHYLTARVTQAPLGAPLGRELHCPFVGPVPAQNDGAPPRGEAGAFHCAASRIERRVMEIDYRPRHGIVVPAEPGRITALEFPDALPRESAGARLVLWFGLHDYYARKTDSGPVDVMVDLNRGRTRVPVQVFPDRGWQQIIIPIGGPGVLRLEVSAKDARARNLGFAGQVRR